MRLKAAIVFSILTLVTGYASLSFADPDPSCVAKACHAKLLDNKSLRSYVCGDEVRQVMATLWKLACDRD